MNGRPPEESPVNRAEDNGAGFFCLQQPGSPGFLLEAGHLWPAVPAPAKLDDLVSDGPPLIRR